MTVSSSSLNEDLQTEFQSVVQYVVHTAPTTGPEYLSTVDELKVHLGQELQDAQILAEQNAFLGGVPTTKTRDVPAWTNSKEALRADLRLEDGQLGRYRERFAQANELGLAGRRRGPTTVARATEEHVRDLQGALGQ